MSAASAPIEVPMQIACPRCTESYRIETARLRASKVRTACLSCGEVLFLRVVDGAGSARATQTPLGRPEAAGIAEEVPLWSEPARTPAGGAATAGPDLARTPVREAPRAPSAEPAAPAPRLPSIEPAAPVQPFAPAASAEPALPPLPTFEPAEEPAAVHTPAEKPLAPYLRPPVDATPSIAAGAPAAEKPLAPFLEPPAAPAAGGRPSTFTFSRVGDVSGRAQRLARALISDIVVYHPKKVEQGNRDGNLKEVLKEEVEKSWDEYSQRLGADVARANRTHFVAALNEILARGNPVF